MSHMIILEGAKEDNDDTVLLPKGLFANAVVLPDELWIQSADATTSSVNDELLTELIAKQARNDFAKQVRASIENPTIPFPGKPIPRAWQEIDGLLQFEGRIYVSDDMALKQKITSQYHNLPSAGHPGRWTTAKLVHHEYYWPSMQAFVTAYVKGCAACQQMKVNIHPTMPPLSPLKPTQ